MTKKSADPAATGTARVSFETATARAVSKTAKAPAQASIPDQPAGINTLDVTIARFWRNRRRDEMIAVRLREYKGQPLIDVRTFFTDRLGGVKPTQRGIVLGVKKLPALAAALNKAVAKAQTLGLLTPASS